VNCIKIALTRSTFSAQNAPNVVAPPGPARELKPSPNHLAVAGGKMRIKEGKGEGKGKEGGKGGQGGKGEKGRGAAHPHKFSKFGPYGAEYS